MACKKFARGCAKFVRGLPPFIVTLVLLWSYYAYVVELCFRSVGNLGLIITFFVLYHIVFIMLLWTYMATVFSKVATPKEDYSLPARERALLDELNLQLKERVSAADPAIATATSGLISAPNGHPPILDDGRSLGTTGASEGGKAVTTRRSVLDPDDATQQNLERRQAILQAAAQHLSLYQVSPFGGIRYCPHCKCFKPDRAHHDSVLSKCVLKMDHFCPWVANTVGFSNYKLFLLFLFYTFLYTVYVMSTSGHYFVRYLSTPFTVQNMTSTYRSESFEADGVSNAASAEEESDKGFGDARSKMNVLFLFILAAMFCLSVSSLLGYHIYLVLSNMTTVESFHPPQFENGPDKRGYNLGWKENLKEVFGDRFAMWFIPVFSSRGNGHLFVAPNKEVARFSGYQPPNRSNVARHSSANGCGNGQAAVEGNSLSSNTSPASEDDDVEKCQSPSTVHLDMGRSSVNTSE